MLCRADENGTESLYLYQAETVQLKSTLSVFLEIESIRDISTNHSP